MLNYVQRWLITAVNCYSNQRWLCRWIVGPNKYTLNDLWRMVWQLKCSRIVMVSNLIEDGRVCLTWNLDNLPTTMTTTIYSHYLGHPVIAGTVKPRWFLLEQSFFSCVPFLMATALLVREKTPEFSSAVLPTPPLYYNTVSVPWKLCLIVRKFYYHYNRFTSRWILSRSTQVSQHQKGKTRKVKPIWIYWSKR